MYVVSLFLEQTSYISFGFLSFVLLVTTAPQQYRYRFIKNLEKRTIIVPMYAIMSQFIQCGIWHVPLEVVSPSHSYFTRSITFAAVISTNCTSCRRVRSDLHQHFTPRMEHR